VIDVISYDPRTGRAVETVAPETTPAQVDALCAAAVSAAPALEALGRVGRAELLRTLAAALEGHESSIVPLADRETALGETRLAGELRRTCYQLRLFAEVLEEGSYLEAAIDHPGQTAMGPRPDLRRMLVPIGPVAVFGASNFPLAFSVPGGDTAAALAAGCPVVIKAHHSHPATSQLCFDVLRAAAAGTAPDGSLSLVHGLDAGAALVAHPVIRAVGFTGSLAGGKALVSIIEERPDPVPFFGELSSLNPVVVTPQAARERPEEIGRGLVGSVTLGAGQFCTKPGLVFVPAGADGDAVLSEMADRVRELGPQWVLNQGIAESYRSGVERLTSAPGVQVVSSGSAPRGEGFEAVPMLLATSAAALPDEVTHECFGPVAVVARYDDAADLDTALDLTPASLTATVLRGDGESELPGRLSDKLRPRAGRFVFDAFPTGVAVSWAQHHGGPWPSTNSQHTSVGTTAIRRFLRPVTWQDAPPDLLPRELQDDCADVPRRVDGVLHLASSTEGASEPSAEAASGG
jgi:NADP-dependent aldehyde dehydrogenase